jgi:chemotaxis protein MotB
MATGDEEKPTIIIRRKKKGGHGHHGGSWKVAFADFATAMMAFFLLMWLMGATTEKQKGAISEYFNNPSAVQGASTVPSPNSVQGPGGSSTSMIKLGGGMELYREPTAKPDENPLHNGVDEEGRGKDANLQADEEKEEEKDKARLDGLVTQLRTAIDERESLAKYKSQILLDVTAEGVRIQIVDQEPRSMFPLGSSKLEEFSENILHELSTIIQQVPNRISISGHTDVKPYVAVNYSNWELSADRANAARRALIGGGLPADKIGRVVGLGSSVPLDPQKPDSSVNRRISIVVLNKRTEDAITQENGSLLSVQGKPEGDTQADAAQPMQVQMPRPQPVAAN